MRWFCLAIARKWEDEKDSKIPAEGDRQRAETKKAWVVPNIAPGTGALISYDEGKKKTASQIAPRKAKKSKTSGGAIIDLSKLPPVDSTLTVSQFLHELLHRQPNVKGASSKPQVLVPVYAGDPFVLVHVSKSFYNRPEIRPSCFREFNGAATCLRNASERSVHPRSWE